MPALTDPWFDAEFYGNVLDKTLCTDSDCSFVNAAGQKYNHHHEGGYTTQGDCINGAQGVTFWCPCGFNDPKYREEGDGKPHSVIIPFSNPRGAPAPGDAHGALSVANPTGPRPRWTMSGAGLHDLTLSPSVAVGSPNCFHGWIQSGQVVGL